MAPLNSVLRAASHRSLLSTHYPWITTPLIICAPMRVMSGPHLALQVSAAGGLGFIGPGTTPSATLTDLEEAASILSSSSSQGKLTSLAKYLSTSSTLPLGVGFQTWNGSLSHATAAVKAHPPAAAWLFAPRHGQTELDEWASALREASPNIKIWVQVGTLTEAKEAAAAATPPDVLVLQGAEAGGHGRTKDGMGVVALLPEVADALGGEHLKTGESRLADIPLIAAGGLVDGRGVTAALGLGAAGVAMGTRFLASHEARIADGYRNAVVNAEDGAAATTRTHLYNHLRGTFGWPEQWAPRALLNQSWRDHTDGKVDFEELKRKHDEMAKAGHEKAYTPEEGRLGAYLGASVGLVREVGAAGEIVEEVRSDAKAIMKSLLEGL